MIRAVCFDLDGVLADLCDLHFRALNRALYECGYADFVIQHWDRHLYEALPTRAKLEMLSQKGLPRSAHDQISAAKQSLTIDCIDDGFEVFNEYNIVKKLHESGLKLACCSNSVRTTIEHVLRILCIDEWIDLIVSNEDVDQSKPHPECYIKAMKYFGVTPRETIILEDSYRGLMAAFASRAWVFPVRDPSCLDLDLLEHFIDGINKYESH